MWTKPTFVDLRLGLEVTLYISNRKTRPPALLRASSFLLTGLHRC